MFESVVKLKGYKPYSLYRSISASFESVVKLKGYKPAMSKANVVTVFESVVKLRGSKPLMPTLKKPAAEPKLFTANT